MSSEKGANAKQLEARLGGPHHLWLQSDGRYGRPADLSGWSFRDEDISFVSLDYVNLTGADFSGATLFRADLSSTELKGADFTGANLLFANLICANLEGATLRFTDLRNADFGGANLREAKLEEISHEHLWEKYGERSLRFSEERLGSKLKLHEIGRVGVDLSEASLRGANLTRADLRGANLSGADLGKALLREAKLIGANLSGANLAGADLTRAILCESNLIGARFMRTSLAGADLTNARIYGIAAWDLTTDENTVQRNLIITPHDAPLMTVDDIEVAQFIYLLLNNQAIRKVIDTITSKAVLILGRFSEERKPLLDVGKTTVPS